MKTKDKTQTTVNRTCMHACVHQRKHRWALMLLRLAALHAIIMLWQAGTENDSNSGNESEIARMGDRGLAVWKLSPHKPNNQGERGREEGRKWRREERQEGKMCPALLRSCQTRSEMISLFLSRTFQVRPLWADMKDGQTAVGTLLSSHVTRRNGWSNWEDQAGEAVGHKFHLKAYILMWVCTVLPDIHAVVCHYRRETVACCVKKSKLSL